MGEWNVKGWIPSPVPAYQIVSVIVQAQNPEIVEGAYFIPLFVGIATQPAPDFANGALLFVGPQWSTRPNVSYGVTIWYHE
jgi:hypothetical protein